MFDVQILRAEHKLKTTSIAATAQRQRAQCGPCERSQPCHGTAAIQHRWAGAAVIAATAIWRSLQAVCSHPVLYVLGLLWGWGR